MMKSFTIIQITNGVPAVNLSTYPLYGYVLCAMIPGYGAYLLSGTVAQINAINGAPGVMKIATVSDWRGGKAYALTAQGSTTINLAPTGANTQAAIVGEVMDCLGMRYSITAVAAPASGRQTVTLSPELLVDVPANTPVLVGPATRWGELDNVIDAAMINRWNNYRGTKYAAIPAGYTYRQAINFMFRYFDANFAIESCDVAEPA
jgi:hypothetical protein